MQPQSPQPDQNTMPPLPMPAPVMPMPADPAPQMNTLQPVQQNNENNVVADTTQTSVAADSDTIEASWVHKIKNVFATTINDPFESNRQFSQLKAEYISTRYGKQIKTGD